MLRALFNAMLRGARRRALRTGHSRPARFIPSMLMLEAREVPAVVASFAAGTLTVFGDANNNNITVSRNAAGAILVNGGAVSITGGTPTVANTALVQVFGRGGSDVIALDETNGALPRANLFGNYGNDTLIGGAGNDMLFGQVGNDTLLGKGGFDLLFGGANNDILTGGDADDQAFGQGGNDRMIWNPGDDTDLNEGGIGTDTVEVNGGNGLEEFTTTANGTRVRFDRIDPAPFSIDIGTSENLVVNMNGGNDKFSATGNLAALIKITVDGGTGDDTILGSNGNDQLQGGDGNDFIDGQQGNDTASMGAGNDVFQWDPGDGNDIVEGGDGTDTMLFNGSAGNEEFEASANGSACGSPAPGNIVMTSMTSSPSTSTPWAGPTRRRSTTRAVLDITEININQAGTIGGTAGDGAADIVIVNGTNGNDTIQVLGSGTTFAVAGLSATVLVTNSEGANDSLVVKALGGNDNVNASTTAALGGIVKLTIDGGAGDDALIGSRGDDVLFGGDGNDFIFGDDGNDRAEMGAGDDVFQWNPGDGNDTIEGQDGKDTMLFFGANIDEEITISANGGRVSFFRDVATVTMDLNDVEAIDFRALGGADKITVGDLSGTDMADIRLDLSGPNGGGDGAVDTVTVTGTNGDDAIQIADFDNATRVALGGLSAFVSITGTEGANDQLTVNALDGNDVVDAGSLSANAIGLTLNGGRGEDILIGGDGNDLINGGDGNDTALMGAGDDTFVWNPGDDNDTLEGQDGSDTMLFNGAVIDEEITISAAADGHVTFFRNIANVTMDLNDVEGIDFTARGGADKITVNDLSGTDVTEVNLDLKANPDGDAGDGAVDTVTVFGTNGDDIALVAGGAKGVSVTGLAATVNIIGAEAANDRLTINALDGDDVVEASALAANGIQLTADGGAGDDVLVGGAGNDTFSGGDGDDTLLGGPGLDVLDGGTGDNTVIQD